MIEDSNSNEAVSGLEVAKCSSRPTLKYKRSDNQVPVAERERGHLCVSWCIAGSESLAIVYVGVPALSAFGDPTAGRLLLGKVKQVIRTTIAGK